MKLYPNRPHVVYRAFDEYGLLLYIGCTMDLEQRLTQHRFKASWHQFMARHTVETYPNRAAARDAEQAAIETEGAFFNSTFADVGRSQSNRAAAGRELARRGIVHDPHASEAESLAYYDLREQVREELKASGAYPCVTDQDRVARYLAARDERGAA